MLSAGKNFHSIYSIVTQDNSLFVIVESDLSDLSDLSDNNFQ